MTTTGGELFALTLVWRAPEGSVSPFLQVKPTENGL
jgi:hypothetical protein